MRPLFNRQKTFMQPFRSCNEHEHHKNAHTCWKVQVYTGYIPSSSVLRPVDKVFVDSETIKAFTYLRASTEAPIVNLCEP